ncbi:MAG: hypothetical protein JSV66_04905 [Trueperaceae bacterium]|nr:MAG: hypothetical protein JSV66_04905 [Trueperaceae bacterium]
MQSSQVFDQSQATRQLELDDALCGRYAEVYEAVFGPLPRSEEGGRLFSPEVIQRLCSARRLVEVGVEASLRSALAASATSQERGGYSPLAGAAATSTEQTSHVT